MLAIGIDIGGTSIKGAAVTDEGKMYNVFSMPMKKDKPADEVVKELALIIKQYLEENSIEEQPVGIGIGIPGSIDSEKGMICSSPNLPLWQNFNIKSKMEEATGLPVRITNDANAATLGEVKFGVGKNAKSAILITLGTGIGSGIIIDGKLYEGNECKGAEIGHTTLILGGRECTCGRKGCFEAYASATALIKDTKAMMEKHPKSKMKDISLQLGGINAAVPFKAEQIYEDKWATEVINQYVMYLSEGLLNICNVFRPEKIILSGGVANEGDYLLDKIKRYVKNKDYGYKGSPVVDITTGILGYDSGKIGAAALFF